MSALNPTRFGDLYLEPSRNGLTKPKRLRGSGTKMVNMGEIFAHGRIHDIDMDRVPLEPGEAASLLDGGDLLFARQSLVLSGAGKCSIFLGDKEPVCFESHIIRVRPDPKKAVAAYLYYFFQSPGGRNAILSIVEQGAGVAGIRGSDLANLWIEVQSLQDQKPIAELLATLDDKIELNRRVNETLEAMAQAIFRDWFVDFGPVCRKLAGATGPVEIMGGVTADPTRAAELARLFPERLDQDGLPSGWQQGAAHDLIEFNPREAMRSGTLAPYSDMASLPTKGTATDPPVMRPFSSGMRFRNGDALLARITPSLENGKGAWVDFLSDDVPIGWGSTEFIVLRGRAGTPSPFGYLLTRDPDFRQHAIQSMTGTSGRQRAQAESLEAWPVALPPPSVLEAFGEHVNPLFARITVAAKESRTLAEARDYLLPRLMSGEVRVDGMAQEIAA